MKIIRTKRFGLYLSKDCICYRFILVEFSWTKYLYPCEIVIVILGICLTLFFGTKKQELDAG